MNKRVLKIFVRIFCFLLGLKVAAFVMAETPQPSVSSVPDITTKVVRQYALISANDFPQRDPQDWRLLASNDDGKSWVTLDIRQDELFSERHQRRVFAITNDTAFNIYRLQIDRVRDPASADAVQLSGLELMGKSKDDFSPTPLFCDLITAQGENPPAETVHEIFDSRMETKWLDKASQHRASRSSWIQWQYLDHKNFVITNINQLLSLQARAEEGYPVRIDGVVVGQIPKINKLCVLDTSGCIEISVTDQWSEVSKWLPGQRILLDGISQWKNNHAEIQQLQFQEDGSKAPAEAAQMKPGQPINPDEELQWVEVEGQVQFLTRSEKLLEFDLVGNGHNISVHILDTNSVQSAPLSGAHVRVRGLCEGVLDENGNQIAGILWVPSLDALSLISETNEPAKNTGRQTLSAEKGSLLTQIDRIRHLTLTELARTPTVKVCGVVTEPSGTYIQDGTGGIEVWIDSQTILKKQGLGSYVEVEGRAFSAAGHGVAGYGPVIIANKLNFLGNGKLPDPIHPSWSLLESGQTDAQWIEIEAVVHATDGSHLLLACEGGQLMATIVSAPASAVNSLVDATIRVRGVSIAASNERGNMQGVQLVVPSMEFIEVENPPADGFSLPPRKISSLLQVRSPNKLIHRVKIEGIITGMGNDNYFIQDSSGGVMAMAKQDVTLSLPVGGWWSFCQNPKTNTISQVETELKTGDQVEVVGFPETHGDAPVLTEATLRKAGQSSAILPVKSTAADLARGNLDSILVTLDGRVLGSETVESFFALQIQSGQKVFQAFLPLNDKSPPDIASGSRIRVVGVCQMEPVTHGEFGKSPASFSILLRNLSDISLLELPPWLTARRTLIALGTLIVILLSALVWIRLLHRQVGAQTQQLRQEIADHEKTEQLLDRKTQLLQREVQEHEKTETVLAEKTDLLKEEIKERKSIYAELEEKKTSLEREIEERERVQMEAEKIHRQLLTTSRMAGMADVATNVLHNVGNVLNGVNVLASSIASHVQKSKTSGVSNLATLLAQHQTDLGHFLTEDANGKHIPTYLQHLGTHLEEEQSRLVEKIKSLTESIQHIKEIVAMQQNYAKVSGILETISFSEIVEDALKMCREALDRHQIKVVRDYAEMPPAIFDRHKVLQILFNLLDNAKHACEACNHAEKQVTVKIYKPGDEKVQVEVTDNGVGIPPENLNRIFTQGFSTRKDGHGFGLHSSILAAQDMGGSLAVRSDGLDKGATFILRMPLIIKDAKVEKPVLTLVN